MRFLRCSLVGIAIIASGITSTLSAQEAEAKVPTGLGFGLKAGMGADPGQFVVGAQFALGKAGFGLLRVIPNVHVGLGDATTTDFNIDFLARVIMADKGLGLYGGIAPTYTAVSDASDFGGTWIVGAQLPLIPRKATNIEARIGFGGAPNFRLLAVVVF